MLLPEGQESSDVGCYLEILPIEKLVWISALGPGYQPAIRAAGTERMRIVVFHRRNHARSAGSPDEIRSSSHAW
jgi:hypothetical protein